MHTGTPDIHCKDSKGKAALPLPGHNVGGKPQPENKTPPGVLKYKPEHERQGIVWRRSGPLPPVLNQHHSNNHGCMQPART
jgi:hypothetical protein